MRRPRLRRRPRRAVPPGRVPTSDDLLAVLRAGWPQVGARPGFVDRVVLAVRRVAAAGEGPQRPRSRLLVGAAGAFLLAFAAGIVEAGRGGVRGVADDVQTTSSPSAAPVPPRVAPRPAAPPSADSPPPRRLPPPSEGRRAPP